MIRDTFIRAFRILFHFFICTNAAISSNLTYKQSNWTRFLPLWIIVTDYCRDYCSFPTLTPKMEAYKCKDPSSNSRYSEMKFRLDKIWMELNLLKIFVEFYSSNEQQWIHISILFVSNQCTNLTRVEWNVKLEKKCYNFKI